MVDAMEATEFPLQTWSAGFAMVIIVPFLGLLLALTDPPTWLQLVAIVIMVLLAGAGTGMMFRRKGGWRPSDTLPDPDDDGRY